jgi:NitT/TauT family transport system substrate-binding protein
MGRFSAMSSARGLLAVLALSIGLQPSSSGHSRELALRVGVMPISDSLQIFVADAKGFFKNEGLKVTVTTLPGGAAIAAALEGGSLDVGWSALVPHAQAYVKGFEFLSIAPGSMWDESAYAGKKSHTVIMVPANSESTGPKGFEGKRVAVGPLKSLSDLLFVAWAERGGADLSKIQRVELGFGQMEAALQRGQIDGIVEAEPFVTSILENKVGVILANEPYSAIAKKFMIGTWIGTRTWVDSHAKEAAAFSAAVREATQFINKQPQEARKILALYTRLSETLAEKMSLTVFSDVWETRDLQVVVDAMAKHGFIAQPFQVNVLLSKYMR